MHADLVSASGLDLEFNQRELAVWRIYFSLHGVMGDRLAAAGTARRHSRAPLRMAADGTLNGPAILFWPAVNQGNVGFVHLASAELSGQTLVRFIILCYHHQAAGGPIQAMHNSGTKFATDRGESSKMME